MKREYGRGEKIEENKDHPATEDEDEVIEQRVKVIIVGDPGAGKHDVAKGADICVPFKSLGVSIGKKINLDRRIKYKLTLIFWTLTKHRPKLTTYFSGAGAAIIVGDITKKRSIKKMRFWANSIQKNIGKIPLFFVGTKNNSKRKIDIDLLSELANDFNSHYFVLKSSQEDRLKPIFKSIAKHIARNYSKLIKDFQPPVVE